MKTNIATIRFYSVNIHSVNLCWWFNLFAFFSKNQIDLEATFQMHISENIQQTIDFYLLNCIVCTIVHSFSFQFDYHLFLFASNWIDAIYITSLPSRSVYCTWCCFILISFVLMSITFYSMQYILNWIWINLIYFFNFRFDHNYPKWNRDWGVAFVLLKFLMEWENKKNPLGKMSIVTEIHRHNHKSYWNQQ